MFDFLKSLFANSVNRFDDVPSEFYHYAEQAINLITTGNGQLEDRQLLELFEKHGIPAKEAVELLLFLPPAFCRKLLPIINWPNYYFEYISAKKSLKRFYASNKRYMIIQSALQAYIDGDFIQSDYLKIAARSASFHSINQILLDNPGRKITEIIVTPETVVY